VEEDCMKGGMLIPWDDTKLNDRCTRSCAIRLRICVANENLLSFSRKAFLAVRSSLLLSCMDIMVYVFVSI